MKVQLGTKEFKKFDITLTIESEIEARELYHRFNIHIPPDTKSVYYGFEDYEHECFALYNFGEAHKEIRQLIEEQGIKP